MPNLTKSLCNSQRSPTSLKCPSKVAEIHQKEKTGWNHIGLKVKKVRKRSVAFGWHLVFSIRTCSGTVSRCTTDYCQTSTWDKSKKLASEQTITTIREKNGCCRIEMRPCEHDRPSCPTPQRYRPRQTRHGGCSHSQSCV